MDSDTGLPYQNILQFDPNTLRPSVAPYTEQLLGYMRSKDN